MKLLILLIICSTVTSEPGILSDVFKLFMRPGEEKSEYAKYPTDNVPSLYESELGAQSDEQNNTLEKIDDIKSSQSPSLTSQLFKYAFDGVDTLLDKFDTKMASKQNFNENEEDMDYTHLGIPQKVYWYYANKGVVPILGSGGCSCPFELQRYNQKIPFNGDVQYMNSRGSYLEHPGY